MLKKFKIFIWTLILFGSVSCVDNDNIGPIEKVNFLQFDFPQGNALWDKEIEQIAKDWGMYIIYKNVDSTHLNRMWVILQTLRLRTGGTMPLSMQHRLL